MELIDVVLVDEEEEALEVINQLLKKDKDFNVVGKYTNTHLAFKKIKTEKPQVIFIDPAMENSTGLLISKKIASLFKNSYIIFTASSDQYALEAFEIKALDYLTKPYNEDRLQKTINRIVETIELTRVSAEIKTEEVLSRKRKTINKIPVYKEEKIALINPREILYCTAENKEVKIILKEETYYTQQTLTQLEYRLNTMNFFRCHRSYLVNLEKIYEIIPWFNNTYILKLKDIEDEVQVSRGYAKELKNALDI